MLKFLEEAQIDRTEAIKQRSTATDIDYDILDEYQRQRQVVSLEKLLFGDS